MILKPLDVTEKEELFALKSLLPHLFKYQSAFFNSASNLSPVDFESVSKAFAKVSRSVKISLFT